MDRSPDERPAALGPLATRILYEDDQVRIWDQRLAPGERTAPHRHDHDYALLDVAGEKLGVWPVPGHPTAAHLERYLELPVKRGQVFFVPRGSTEQAENIGALPYRGIVVEIKG